MLSSGTFTAKLIKKSKVSRDAYSFYFERSPAFQFLPGQYIKMTLNIENPDERGNSRFLENSFYKISLKHFSCFQVPKIQVKLAER